MTPRGSYFTPQGIATITALIGLLLAEISAAGWLA
jgi:hypothetical protein